MRSKGAVQPPHAVMLRQRSPWQSQGLPAKDLGTLSAQQRTSSDHPGAFFTLEWEAKLASESSKPVALWSTGELRFAPKGRARTWGTGHFAPLSQRTDFLSRQHTKVFPICDLHKSPELSLGYRVQKTIHNPAAALHAHCATECVLISASMSETIVSSPSVEAAFLRDSLTPSTLDPCSRHMIFGSTQTSFPSASLRTFASWGLACTIRLRTLISKAKS
jgi:hypothetical protein